MKALELKIPPPLVALLFALAMWLSSSFSQPYPAPLGLRISVALALLVLGQGISISGMRAFRIAKTTINPFKPSASSSLVERGVYRFTRNPMYLGLLVTLAGWAAFLSSFLPLLFLPVFVLYIDRLQIAPEERALAALFGAGYSDYCARVHRWV